MTILKYLTRVSFIGIFVIVVLFSNIVGFVTDWWWFSSVGHTQIFITALVAKLALFSGVGIFAAVFRLRGHIFFAGQSVYRELAIA